MRVSMPNPQRFVRRAAAAAVCGLLLASAATAAFAGTPTATPTPINPAPSGSNPPAARFYGAVTDSSGNPTSDGTNVVAMSSSGATCGSVNVGDPPASSGNYVLDDAGSDPSCSAAGSTLTFSVAGQNANTSVAPTVPDGSGALHVDLSTP